MSSRRDVIPTPGGIPQREVHVTCGIPPGVGMTEREICRERTTTLVLAINPSTHQPTNLSTYHPLSQHNESTSPRVNGSTSLYPGILAIYLAISFNCSTTCG